jgi:alkanesulfonate monooxygenase SsuD/methylene tetrahydromethanopterin reductase-like flavin-dependent oxidoreductase (luciferase family)
VPILIGGHGDAALRRAARLDGWMSAGTTDEELDRNIARLGELRREYGRDDVEFEVHAPSIDGFSADGISRLEERGVTDVIAGFRDPYTAGADMQSLQEKLDALRWYADEVIAKVRG